MGCSAEFAILCVVSLTREPIVQLAGPGRPQQVSKNRRLISTLLMLTGLIVIGYPSLTEAYGYFAQYQLNQSWESELARQEQLAASVETEQIARLGNRAITSEDAVLEQALKSVGDADSTAWPATKIKIPKIGVEQVVLDSVDSVTLKNGPGHYRGTTNPGKRGTIGIAGHRVTYTHPFNRIDELEPGDAILLETLDSIYEYRVVRSDVLDPEDLSALLPKKDDRARLTLTTCTPKYSAKFRLDVQASLVKVTRRRQPTILRRFVKNIIPETPDSAPQNAIDLWVQRARENVAVRPNDAGARIELGMVYRRIGRHEDAVTQLEKAARIDPTNATAFYQIASVYDKTKDVDSAIEAAEQSVYLEPGFEAAHYLLGTLYLETNDAERAVRSLSKALDLNSLSGDTHFLIGRAYEELGDLDLAEEAYEKAVRYIPDFLEAKAALRRLARLEPPIKTE